MNSIEEQARLIAQQKFGGSTHSCNSEIFNAFVLGYIEHAKFVEPEKVKYGMEKWNEAINTTLSSLSDTFLNPENLKKADSNNDRVVFKAIGQTIQNYPLPEFKP